MFQRQSYVVEAREQDGRQAPAYYLAAAWFRDADLLPGTATGVLPFDARWWQTVRSGAHGRDPRVTLWRGEPSGRCPVRNAVMI